ncbi:MAG: ATP-binding protein [Pseudomonadota bacterium]
MSHNHDNHLAAPEMDVALNKDVTVHLRMREAVVCYAFSGIWVMAHFLVDPSVPLWVGPGFTLVGVLMNIAVRRLARSRALSDHDATLLLLSGDLCLHAAVAILVPQTAWFIFLAFAFVLNAGAAYVQTRHVTPILLVALSLVVAIVASVPLSFPDTETPIGKGLVALLISWVMFGCSMTGLRSAMARRKHLNAKLRLAKTLDTLSEKERELKAQRDNLEIAVQDRTADLEHAMQAANEANIAKSRFLANMSHEIRTPLNGILGMGQLLEDSDLAKDQQKMLVSLNYSGRALLAIVNDVLDISKVQAGQMTLKPQAFCLHALLENTVQMFSGMAGQRGLPLSLETEIKPPVNLSADAGRLRQILSNLINNAIKFTDSGSVRIVVRAPDVADAHWHFEVIDTGIGIPADKQQHIFDSFTQVDDGSSRRYDGTGLGLSISAELARLFGGTLSVESREGFGSRFFLSLPLAEATNSDLAENTGIFAIRAAGSQNNRILVVEDNLVNQKVAEAMLRKLGYEAVIVGDGFKAIELVGRDTFALVLMDCQMPGMDGFETVRRIRTMTDCGGDTVPIVAVTANAMSGDRDACLAAGMDAYLSKPFQLGELSLVIDQYVGAGIQVASG